MSNQIVKLSHDFIRCAIKYGDFAVDATMGNGHDTLFLAELGCNVFAFDIQQQALNETKKKLKEHNLHATLILDGHENIDKYVNKPIKVAMLNLGYLPNGNKEFVTKPETTLVALEKLAALLIKGGRMSVTVYSGHNGGETEKQTVLNWIQKLNKSNWNVIKHEVEHETKNPPPVLLCLEKL